MIRTKKIIQFFYSALVITLGLLSFVLFSECRRGNLEFIVFDIGQGDSIFIRTPARQNILIDGGPDNAVIYKLGQYLPFYDRQIDLMILTHPHSDHVLGLVEVLKRYQVKKILTAGVQYNSPDYLAWQNLVALKNIPVQIVDHPGIMPLGIGGDLIILFPDRSFLNQKVKNLNNVSIVVKFSLMDWSIILPGDYEEEEKLVSQSLNLAADILKVSHHGSDTGNSLEFLRAVDPEIAVISCGQNNKFNHPHPSTLQNLDNIGSEVFRTDQQGDFYLDR